MRDGTGHFIFDPEFIPPLTSIAASDRLMHILKRLIEILDDKSASLSKGSAATARTWAEYSTRDVAQFWLLHTVNSALAPLRDMYTGRHVHPGTAVRADAAPGRRAVHLCDRIAPARSAALQSQTTWPGVSAPWTITSARTSKRLCRPT